MPSRLILASASPRRRELLTQAGFTFAVELADLDETLLPGEGAAAYVLRLAEAKARAVLARHPGEVVIVLGADTSVVLGDSPTDVILGKPRDAADAARMLRLLSGRTHRVLTGLAAVSYAAAAVTAVESTEVTFATIFADELARYCATPEPLDKAGAYGIQGYAARWIPRIDGCYFNVMGLPIARVVELLRCL